MLALVWAVHNFQAHLSEQVFTARTDHHSLNWLKCFMIQRAKSQDGFKNLKLPKYNIEIEHHMVLNALLPAWT